MTDPRYARVRELFLDCVDLDATARDAFLARHCADDPRLEAELRALLQADHPEGSPLDRGMGGSDVDEGLWIGREFGNYRVTGLLAAGGMGVVFAGRQKEPDRPVALKVIRSGLPSRETLARFRRESAVLGRLDHPGIARVIEAGSADMGAGPQPYFAMEFVEGRPITEYRAGLVETLGLFVKVAGAIQHAHGRGVVHRDLKPGNILVRDDGQVKVLDFGVARLTDADLNATMQSEIGQMLGTLAYMSPEQVRGDHAAIDARTDVYALGVVMHEVLTGRLPHDMDESNMAQVVRAIEDEAARTLAGRPDDPGYRYPEALVTIVGKCLEKDPERRYASAAAVGADLQRFLNDRPIAARPPSSWDLARRFAARNRGLVAGLAVAAAVLVIGTVVSVTGWIAAESARREADREFKRAEAVNGFLLDMLRAPDPWAAGPEVKVVEILDRSGASIDSTLAGDPETAASAHGTIATTYEGLGVYDKAGEHYRRAYRLTRGSTNRFLRVVTLRNLLQFEIDDGRLAEVDSLVREIEAERADLPAGSRLLAEASHVLGAVGEARGDLERAETLYRESMTISRQVLGRHAEATLASQMNLGVVLMQAKQFDESLELLTEVHEVRRERLGPEHPRTLIIVNNLAVVLRELERHDEALEMCRQSLAARLKVHGPDSPSVMVGEHNLGLQLGRMGRHEEALVHHEQAAAVALRSVGAEHPRAHMIAAALGRAQFHNGLVDDAEATLLAAHSGLSEHFGTDHWRVRTAATHLAELYEARGDDARASQYR